jgi:hypothetical protein
MIGGPVIAAQARLELRRHGTSATLTTYSGGTADTYGDNTFSSTSTAVKVLVKVPRGRTVVSIGGEERVVDAQFWLADTWSVGVDPTRVPQVAYRGVTYEVVHAINEGAGLKRLDTVRIR